MKQDVCMFVGLYRIVFYVLCFLFFIVEDGENLGLFEFYIIVFLGCSFSGVVIW